MSIEIAGELATLAEQEERERCVAICEGWLAAYEGVEIKYTSARKYATDAVKDIRDAIISGTQPDRMSCETQS